MLGKLEVKVLCCETQEIKEVANERQKRIPSSNPSLCHLFFLNKSNDFVFFSDI